MDALRDVYAQKALAQVPRLLSAQDRNVYSPTYGCMNREFWLCRSTDFPNSIAQFGVHALALAYTHSMPGNVYYQHPKVLEWTLAGMEYWTRIQNRDGSFDEFYPNERGWAGPTGFLLYAMCDSYRLLETHIPSELKERLLAAFHRAALFLAGTDEAGVLANHHAMAILPMYEAFLLVHDGKIEKAFREKLDLFFSFVHEEGWCLEYDWADPGYLSATISFMAKLAKRYEDERFFPFFQKAVEFTSYFAYPNGHFGGTVGSRQTLHFYPHGYERLCEKIPLAAAVADRMLMGLRDGALVPPEIQGERYFVYRIPELMQAYIDYGRRTENLPLLPWEREPFQIYFPGAKILVDKRPNAYTVINAAKGGVVKNFLLPSGKLVVNHCGIWGQLEKGVLFTSQWIDEATQVERGPDGLRIRGRCHKVPAKVFNPVTFILFRLFMLAFGWHARLAYHVKGWIRRVLMLGAKPLPLEYDRTITLYEDGVEIQTRLATHGNVRVTGLLVGDEFPARYVPQSRYFQPQELEVRGYRLSREDLDLLHQRRGILVTESRREGDTESQFTVKEI